MRLLPVPLLLAALAHAELPLPAYPECAHDALDQCPNDLGEGDWEQVSWIPDDSADSVRPEELAIGAGVGLDVALHYGAGRWDVPIAFLDTGIRWEEGSLAKKVRLNTAELPLPEDASGETRDTYDLNGDGVANIDDWQWDPRVRADAGDDPTDGMLDPSDLIATFSDGVDADGNGYIDDIAGWDFYQDDNDPFADLDNDFTTHGSGVMEGAADEGNDGHDIGACPNCSIIPLRTGDGVLSDGDRVGLGIAYAADNGARAVSMALGALSHSRLTDAAIAYADSKGVVMVAVSADENSWHHNLPSFRDPLLVVHSIRGDNSREGDGDVYSFLNYYNCNNYGPRLELVAPSNGCATGSDSTISGIAGFLVSLGLDTGADLEPDEVRALLRSTATDIDVPEEDRKQAGGPYPSHAGWDPYYGYGRANQGAAATAVATGAIPPIARLESPDWFDFVDPDGPIAIEGRIAAPRSSVASWTLEVGTGLDPQDWTKIGSGSGDVDGTIGTLDASTIPSVRFDDLSTEDDLARAERAHEPCVTARLTVTDADGRTSVDRHTFYVHRDATRFEAFPVSIGGSGESEPAMVDLDGDGRDEIVVATGSGDVHAYEADGTEKAGFPVATDVLHQLTDGALGAEAGFASGALPQAHEGVIAHPAIGDLDGDGSPEIVVASLRGGVYAWHADGTVVQGFPVRIQGHPHDEWTPYTKWDEGTMAAPVLADVDGDGKSEVIVGGLDQRLYVWHGDGSPAAGWPQMLCAATGCSDQGARIVSTPAVGDIDGDGDLDVAVGTDEVPKGAAGPVYLYDLKSGEPLPGSPLLLDGLINRGILPVIGEGNPSAIALADVDGDGQLELAANPMLGVLGMTRADGTPVYDAKYTADSFGPGSNFTEGSLATVATEPAIGDLDQDGVPDLFYPGSSATYLVSLFLTKNQPYEHGVVGFSGADGSSLPGFPRQLDDVPFLEGSAVADVSGDGKPEVVVANGGFVYAWDADGHLASGFPKFEGGWTMYGPAVGDVDGDGYLDVAVTTREGQLFVWRTNGPADGVVEWSSVFHDPANTGNYETPLRAYPGPPDAARGCCGRKGGGTETSLVLLPALLWGIRRRRR